VNKFNLTFSGEILPGYDPARSKATLAEILALDDPTQVEHFFTGNPVILLRNLDRKAAAESFAQLKKVGVNVALEKISLEDGPAKNTPSPPVSATKKVPETAPAPAPKPLPENRGMDREIREQNIGRTDQSWPISTAVNRPSRATKQTTKQATKEATKPKVETSAPRKPAKDSAPAVTEQDSYEEQLAKKEAALKEAAERRAFALREEKQATEALEKYRALLRQEEEQTAADASALKARKQHEAAESARLVKEKAERKRQEENRKAQVREEEKQKAAEEKAHRKAQREAKWEAKTAEAAKIRAEQVQRKRLAEQQKALEREEKRRLAAQRKARLAAEQQEKARILAQRREQKKRAEEEAKAKRLAKIEEKRWAAEKAKQAKTAKAEQKRREIELAEELKAEQQRKHAEEFARLKEQKAAEKTRREALERASRERSTQEELRIEALKAEQRRLEAEEIARVQAEKMYQLKQQDLATKTPERRAKVRPSKHNQTDMTQHALLLDDADSVELNLARKNPVPAPTANVRSNSKKPSEAIEEQARCDAKSTKTKAQRKSGTPNFFTLKPFRHTSEIRQRALRSAQIKPIAFSVSFIASVALLILCIRHVILPPTLISTGASTIAINQHSQLLLIVGNQLLMHDRAGVETSSTDFEALEVTAVSPPTTFAGENELLLRAKVSTRGKDSTAWQLSRCNLEKPACEAVALSTEVGNISDLAIDPRSGTLYIADSLSQEIYKTTAAGELLARAQAPVPTKARIRLHQGLLYLNSDAAPAISVFRPDEQAFGVQLDEILLLPPPAIKAEQSKVIDFVWSADSWWVSLLNPETHSAGVYRFDDKWNFLGQIELQENTFPDQLQAWADKTLVLDNSQAAIQRFSASGGAEVPLNSHAMSEYLDAQRKSQQTTAALWRLSLAALSLIAVAGLCAGNLHRLRNLVYRAGKEQGAEPISDRVKEVTWIPKARSRDMRYKQLTVAYIACCLLALVTAATLAQSALFVIAIGISMAGPLVGLFLLYSTRTGHIGLLGSQLLLVDHQNFYHLGSGPRILYRENFIMLDDILVFTGTNLLPVFDSKQLLQTIQPIATAGIKVDRKTLLIKLLQSAHPIVKATTASLSCLALAMLVLLAA
jgi:hypothetical protein